MSNKPPLTYAEARKLTDDINAALRKFDDDLHKARKMGITHVNGIDITGKTTRSAPQHAYFIRACRSGLVKIGCASNPVARLKELQTGSPEKLELVGVIPDAGQAGERELHELLAPYRSHGEWFKPSEYLDAAISACRAAS